MAIAGQVAGAIRAGGAFVEIGGDTKALDNALTRAGRKLRSFALKLAGFGAGATGLGLGILIPIKRAVDEAATYGDTIAKMSQRTGIGQRTLFELGHAADLAGASIGDVEMAIRLMQRAIFDAKNGSAQILEAFEAININPESLAGLDPAEQFETIAEGLRRISDDGTRAAVAMKLFGRSGTSLLPLIKMGAKGIAEARVEAHRLGIVMSDELSAASEEYLDNLERLRKAHLGIKITIFNVLGPGIDALVRGITTVLVRLRVWMDRNRALVQFLAKLGAVLTIVGGAALAIAAIITVLSFIAAPLGIVVALVLALATALGFTGKGLEKFKEQFREFLKTNDLEKAFFLLKAVAGFLLKGFLAKAQAFWISFKMWGLQTIGDLMAWFENALNRLLIKGVGVLEKIGLLSKDKADQIRADLSTPAANPFQDQINAMRGQRLRAQSTAVISFLAARGAGKALIDEVKRFFGNLEPDLTNARNRLGGGGAGGLLTQVPKVEGVTGVIGGMDIREQLGGFSVQREQLNQLRGIKGVLDRIRENTEDNEGAVFT